MSLGKFISFEGGDGAGKSTQIAVAESFLRENGVDVVRTREPGGTPLSEKLRALLLENSGIQISVDAELLMMFAARAQHLSEKIIPALNEGQWVLCDRFTDATFAYQGGGRGVDISRITQLEQFVQADFRPDRVFVYDISAEQGLSRAKARAELDRFEQEDIAFFDRVRQSYLNRSKQHPERYVVIDATPDIETVTEVTKSHLSKLINEPT